MNRREFLKSSALLSATAVINPLTLNGCVTQRYVKPDPLTAKDEKLLLTNASIIDVRTGTFREEKQILIQDGKIQDLFFNNEAEISADRQLDLQGAYVLPGLINAHCHLCLPCTVAGLGEGLVISLRRQVERNAEECVKHGVTTVRDMAAISFWLDDLRMKINRGSVVGPRIVSSFGIDIPMGYVAVMSMLGADRRFFKLVTSPRGGIDAVKTAIDNNAGQIKIAQQTKKFVNLLPNNRRMSLEIMRTICDEAARQGIVVAMHHTDTDGFIRGLDAGVTSFEHMPTDRALTDDEIERFLSSGAHIVPTTSVGYAISWETNKDTEWDEGHKAVVKEERKRLLPTFVREYCEPSIRLANIADFKRYSDPNFFDEPRLLPTINTDATNTILSYGTQNTKLLYEAGAKMGCGNDGGIPFNFPGALGLEMLLLEKAEMDTKDILRMATINNAELMGIENDLGSIEAGKIADLAIFKKNPLNTFENALRPSMVFMSGGLAYKS